MKNSSKNVKQVIQNSYKTLEQAPGFNLNKKYRTKYLTKLKMSWISKENFLYASCDTDDLRGSDRSFLQSMTGNITSETREVMTLL